MKKNFQYPYQLTFLPFPILEHIIKNADPSTLFKLSKTSKVLRQWIYRIRGLAVDSIIVTKNMNKKNSFVEKFSHSRVPRIFFSESKENFFTNPGVVLFCDLNDPKSVRLLKNVTTSRSIVFHEIEAQKFPEAKLFNIAESCELKTVNCKLDHDAWNSLLDLKWGGFECKSRKFQPSTSLLIEKLQNIRKICINFNVFAFNDIGSICEWKQERFLKEVVLQKFFPGIQPKILVQFFEEKLDVDSSVQINYHPAVSKCEIDIFQKNLIKWMNKMGGDWAMVGHKVASYVKRQKASKTSKKKSLMKVLTEVINQVKISGN
ncbi:hypothetical protein FO519_007996 [Halicephalobus sp. NKZ332]|nr:hypothetical protein FO519_007996 [Halicephalobus sp. NKZ332]